MTETLLLTRIASLASLVQEFGERQEKMLEALNAQSRALMRIEQRVSPLTVEKIRPSVFKARERFYFEKGGLGRAGHGVQVDDKLLEDLIVAFKVTTVDSDVRPWIGRNHSNWVPPFLTPLIFDLKLTHQT
jgi:hypothetical protein